MPIAEPGKSHPGGLKPRLSRRIVDYTMTAEFGLTRSETRYIMAAVVRQALHPELVEGLNNDGAISSVG